VFWNWILDWKQNTFALILSYYYRVLFCIIPLIWCNDLNFIVVRIAKSVSQSFAHSEVHLKIIVFFIFLWYYYTEWKHRPRQSSCLRWKSVQRSFINTFCKLYCLIYAFDRNMNVTLVRIIFRMQCRKQNKKKKTISSGEQYIKRLNVLHSIKLFCR